MRDRDLYAKLLGIEDPWYVRDVDPRLEAGEVEIFISRDERAELPCPVCGAAAGRYDTRTRTWRHLDTMQYKTLLTAEVPRVKCAEHGVKQLKVPWAEPGSRFTAMFEALVIDWLKEASVSAVARMLRMTWDEVDGVMTRAVARGLERRQSQPLRNIGIDETSFQKRHEYVTVVYDCDRKHVIDVLDNRRQFDLEEFYFGTPLEHLQSLESVSMDMWGPYVQATLIHVPDAERKIAFDRFHVAKHINDGVNKVRVDEHAELRELGDRTLTGTRYLWLKNPENMTAKSRLRFEALRGSSLRVARAWAMKEAARQLWSYERRGWARRAWKRLIGWMARSRLPPMVKVGRTLRAHLWGIVNAIVLGATNASLEAVNSKIQALKKRACGYRSRARFRSAILFHCGGLELYPSAHLVHTNS
ncbi:transposase [Plesiocystis pacifica SIR-1]|uniref:Transposase n=1 Tax=Plesiocystis pacifica SIR-1 TaxID=391625 RepID=A6GIP3_9BACT|nr:ISL3 family transposase [Plesiocystis pacifica]EDM74265.1 transposase [Plesiocystis pacifica SIR-1]